MVKLLHSLITARCFTFLKDYFLGNDTNVSRIRLWIANHTRYEESRDMNEFSYAFSVSKDAMSILTDFFPFQGDSTGPLSRSCNSDAFFNPEGGKMKSTKAYVLKQQFYLFGFTR